MTDNLFRGVGVEVDILYPDNFLKIKETLTRIGIPSVTEEYKKLYQSCHILHKRDDTGLSRYAIVSFKEMFILDGKPSNIDERDYERRNAIVSLLEEWELLDILSEPELWASMAPISTIKIIPFKDKHNWELVSKYQIGQVRKRGSD